MTKKFSERDPVEEVFFFFFYQKIYIIFFTINLKVLKAFRLFDDDNKGKISLRNLKRVARELGETLTDDEL